LCEQYITSGTHPIELNLGFPDGSRAIQQGFIRIRARKLERDPF
jgi:hypothetical protein